jgi:hypothetical protein
MGLGLRRRRLTAAEREYAFEIFRDSIDYEPIVISRGSPFALAAATAIGNTINLRGEHFIGETLDVGEAGRLVLIHELGHIWQFQNGGLAYIPSSLLAQITSWITTGSRRAAYDWLEAHRRGRLWNEWNAEQQAACISDYNTAMRRIEAGKASEPDEQTINLAGPYIERVRRREGAPGRRHRRNLHRSGT